MSPRRYILRSRPRADGKGTNEHLFPSRATFGLYLEKRMILADRLVFSRWQWKMFMFFNNELLYDRRGGEVLFLLAHPLFPLLVVLSFLRLSLRSGPKEIPARNVFAPCVALWRSRCRQGRKEERRSECKKEEDLGGKQPPQIDRCGIHCMKRLLKRQTEAPPYTHTDTHYGALSLPFPRAR